MADLITITLADAAARGSSASGSSVDRGAYSAARLTLSVSAASGTTPALVVVVETSQDGVSWTQAHAFASRSTTGEETLSVAGLSTYVRARWTITGTSASFTFGVAGTSVTCYAGPSDLASHGIPAAALASKSTTEKAEALISATQEINGRFNARYSFPLTAWGTDLTKYTARMAAVDLLFSRGVNPDAPDFATYSEMRAAAERWAADVGKKRIDPPDIVDSTPDEDEAEPTMYTNTKRGW